MDRSSNNLFLLFFISFAIVVLSPVSQAFDFFQSEHHTKETLRYVNQHDPQIGFDSRGDAYCGPSALTNAFVYLVNTGRISIAPFFSQSIHDSRLIAKYLASARCTNVTTKQGAIVDFIVENAPRCIRGLTEAPLSMSYTEDIWVILENLQRRQPVILVEGFYKLNPKTGEYDRFGAHAVLATGVQIKGAQVEFKVVDSEDLNQSTKLATIENVSEALRFDAQNLVSGTRLIVQDPHASIHVIETGMLFRFSPGWRNENQ